MPWWRRVAAGACLVSVFGAAWWFSRFADNAEPVAVTAATVGYIATLIALLGCLVVCLVGVYDVSRLRYLARVHNSTVHAIASAEPEPDGAEYD